MTNKNKIITEREVNERIEHIKNINNWVNYSCNKPKDLMKYINNKYICYFSEDEFGYEDINTIIEELNRIKKDIEYIRDCKLDTNKYNCSWNESYKHMNRGGISEYNKHYYKIMDNSLCCSDSPNGIYIKDDLLHFEMINSNKWTLINN